MPTRRAPAAQSLTAVSPLPVCSRNCPKLGRVIPSPVLAVHSGADRHIGGRPEGAGSYRYLRGNKGPGHSYASKLIRL
jgi:hypothetical protein